MHNTSTESRLILAVQAKRRDPHISLRKLAKLYNVNRSTLYDRYHGKPARRDIIAKYQKLTPTEEESIVQRVIDLDNRSFPPRIRYVEDMANILLKERDAGRVGKNWASNFVRRQKALKTRFNRRIDYQRAFCEDLNVYRKWFQLVRDTIGKHGIAAEDIYNFDETGFMMGMITTHMVVTSAERRGRPRQAQQGDREWATVIQAVNSQGWAIPPFIVLAGKTHLASWYRDSPLPPETKIGVSENGWTTNEVGIEFAKHFDCHTKDRKKGVKRLLILDGHESHHSMEFEEYCQIHGIITLCMPAHSSHKLQPLDLVCFSVLKRAYSDYIETLMQRHQTHIAKEDFLAGFATAFKIAMTNLNIRAGFEAAGLVPLDPEKVISTLPIPKEARTPSPNLDTHPMFWDAKTPGNINEAALQSVYIRNRIRRHHSSSPTSIVEAFDKLAKSTYKLMHENALLKDENIHLRETNHVLSKRRRTKNKRLQAGGVLSVQDGQDLQGEKDGSNAIEHDTVEERSPRKRVATGRRRCGKCGKPGHNARTCEADVDMSNEEDSD